VSDTPTPRTDNFVLEHDFRPSPSDCLNFCVKLERDLAEAMNQLDALADALRDIASGLYDGKKCIDLIAPKALATLEGRTE